MYRVFNMGIGLVLVVSGFYAESICGQLAQSGIETYRIGLAAEGPQGVVWGEVSLVLAPKGACYDSPGAAPGTSQITFVAPKGCYDSPE